MIFCDSQDEETFWSPNTVPRLAGKADKQEVALCQGPQSHTPGGSSIPVWWLKAAFVALAAKKHLPHCGCVARKIFDTPKYY